MSSLCNCLKDPDTADLQCPIHIQCKCVKSGYNECLIHPYGNSIKTGRPCLINLVFLDPTGLNLFSISIYWENKMRKAIYCYIGLLSEYANSKNCGQYKFWKNILKRKNDLKFYTKNLKRISLKDTPAKLQLIEPCVIIVKDVTIDDQ